ncbi:MULTISPECIES: amidase [Streptomyces]|uniref:Amidase n=1 Tax=Streptomyces tendae TaxID=1932 RepID=A0ABW7S729_STRTE|nr:MULTISPECIES: amidase [unclassified Streptomyces]MBQ0967340.1 amidase [Streptomyces sp. RK74B]MBQ1007884.1 amidase [Streptomyces sp. RK23]
MAEIETVTGTAAAGHEMSAVEAAARIADGGLSPVDLAQQVLARIREDDPRVGAYTVVLEESVLEEAERASARIAREGPRGPLDGVPVSVKDLFDVAGTPTWAGSAALCEAGGTPAAADAPVVARLRSAGALLLGKTRMDEFAFGTVTPGTRNPRCPERSAGGSSGGAAAAVAAGMGPLALGTDTGGSVRIPAAMCGVVGLKPTYGVLPGEGVVPLSWSLDTPGVLSRSVADAALAFAVLTGTGTDAHVEPWSVPEPASAEGLTLAVPDDALFSRCSPDVAERVAAAVDLLAAAGARIVRVSLPMADLVSPAVALIMAAEASAHHRRALRDGTALHPTTRDRLEEGALVPARDYIDALRTRQLLHTKWQEAFEGIDAFVLPTVAVPPVAHGEFFLPQPDGGMDVVPVASTRFAHPASLTGLPALSVPCGSPEDGLPVGLQFMGRPHGEQTLLRLGRLYESLSGGPWPVAEVPAGG